MGWSVNEIWFIREEATTPCPGLNVEEIPEYAFDILKVAKRAGIPEITVEGYVGEIPLSGGGTLQIKPKYGAAAYLEMLLAVRGVLAPLNRDTQRLLSAATAEARSPAELVAVALANEISAILTQGRRTERRTRVVTDGYARGVIDARKTALAMAARSLRPVVSRENYPSTMLAEHRVLTGAAYVAERYLSPTANVVPLAALRRWRRMFHHLPSRDDIANAQRKLAEGGFAKSRGYYTAAVSLALVALGFSGLTEEGSRLARDCVLTHMPTLFETYVRKSMSLALTARGVTITKGGLPANEFLYKGGAFELEPDICVYRGAQICAIGDAKYKRPDAKDHYQLLEYMRAFGMRSGFFVVPKQRADDKSLSWETTDGLTVHQLTVDLERPASSSDWITRVESLLA